MWNFLANLLSLQPLHWLAPLNLFQRDIICGGEDRTHRGVLVLGGAHVSHLLIVTLHAWRPPHLNLEPMVHETAVIPLLIKIVSMQLRLLYNSKSFWNPLNPPPARLMRDGL